MFSSVLYFILGAWRWWSELFTGIPYGNPYIAIIVPLLILLCFFWYLILVILRHKEKQELGDQYERTELYKRITNIS